MRIPVLLFMLFLLLSRPNQAASAARKALSVWGLDVAPSLFPYMVYCRFTAKALQKSGLPAAPVCTLLGLLGGSPSGAAVLAAYAPGLSRKTLLRLAALTGTLSPMFFRSTLRIWTGNAPLCRLLLAAHFFGAAFAALCAGLLPDRKIPVSAVQTASGDALSESIQSILRVGGCIVFFSVTAAGLCSFLPGLPPLAGALLHAVLEVSGGLHGLCQLPLSAFQRALLLSACVGFSGLSILTQNAFFLRPLGVRLRELIFLACLRALASCFFLAVLNVLQILLSGQPLF